MQAQRQKETQQGTYKQMHTNTNIYPNTDTHNKKHKQIKHMLTYTETENKQTSPHLPYINLNIYTK